jgi:hypothetical protein
MAEGTSVSIRQALPAVGGARLLRSGDLRMTVPYYIHCDGAAVNNEVEACVWSVSSALVKGAALDTKFVLCIVPTVYMATKAMLQKVHRTVAAVLAAAGHRLLRGVDQTGVPIAGGVSFAFAGCKGDAKARWQMNEFQRSWAHTFVCDSCCATNPVHSNSLPLLTYADAGLNAPWRRTLVSHDAYMLEPGPSPYAAIPGPLNAGRGELKAWLVPPACPCADACPPFHLGYLLFSCVPDPPL